jgi:hypothetical protein
MPSLNIEFFGPEANFLFAYVQYISKLPVIMKEEDES